MDVGPTRSMGFTPNAIERTTPADASARDDGRPAADGAAPMATEDTAPISDRTLVQRLDEVRRNEAARKPDAAQDEAQRDAPPTTTAERNMQRLMEKVAGPLRSYLKDGPLSDDDKKALVEALTQFEADVGRLSETVDAEQLNEEMRSTFERFYLSLKRIFGADSEQGAASTDEASAKSAVRLDESQAASIDEGDAKRPRESGSSPSPTGQEQPDADKADAFLDPFEVGAETARSANGDSVSEAYRRIASMYTALYGDADSLSASLLNEKG